MTERTYKGSNIADQIQGEDAYGYDEELTIADLYNILDQFHSHVMNRDENLTRVLAKWLLWSADDARQVDSDAVGVHEVQEEDVSEKDYSSEFTFNLCPECGGSISRDGLFSNGKMWFYGFGGKCRDCGKEWHVTREDKPEEEE